MRKISGFGVLSRTSQNFLLSHLWAPLFLLRTAYWPSSDAITLLPGYERTLNQIRELKLDVVELEILQNLLLCRYDLLNDSEQLTLAKLMFERNLDNLMVSYFFIRSYLVLWKSVMLCYFFR